MAKMSKTMKIRAIKALTLLTAYLLSTVGAACLAISCHCPHAFYHSHTQYTAEICSCGHCDHTHHDDDCGSLGELLRLQSSAECCSHNHSTDTELYTAGSNESAGIRIAAAPTDAVTHTSDISAAPLTALEKSFAERRCPPAQKCRAVLRPLRAPPVCA